VPIEEVSKIAEKPVYEDKEPVKAEL